MKKVLSAFLFIAISSSVFGQSNTLIDSFLELENADVGTTLLLIAQSAGVLDEKASAQDAYDWALEESFGKHIQRLNPEEGISLGLFYLVLFETYQIKGGLMYRVTRHPRYAALEAGYLGYVEPSGLFATRRIRPYEVLTGIGYVAGGAL
ncbi:MAG: hypothetical protein MI717_08375 [Spirochaetales bacterium]|nr:hypothetical protein [Spirochaetales bacterium]